MTGHSHASILILDDEKPIAELLGELLSLRGYAATVCVSGAEAIAALDLQDFDLVISDLRMPGMSGREFYQRAIEKKPRLARRIVFITGDALTDESLSFLKGTRSPHLSKPFRPVEVEQIVADTLRRAPSG
jgi:CheY-like chemotaxis protein